MSGFYDDDLTPYSLDVGLTVQIDHDLEDRDPHPCPWCPGRPPLGSYKALESHLRQKHADRVADGIVKPAQGIVKEGDV